MIYVLILLSAALLTYIFIRFKYDELGIVPTLLLSVFIGFSSGSGIYSLATTGYKAAGSAIELKNVNEDYWDEVNRGFAGEEFDLNRAYDLEHQRTEKVKTFCRDSAEFIVEVQKAQIRSIKVPKAKPIR